jgi:endonuclease-8
VLESVEAIGKHLLFRFEGGVTLRSHLRLSGRWRLDPANVPRRGRPWLVLRGTEWEATQWNGPVLSLDARPAARLGPDLLAAGTDPVALVARLRRADGGLRLGEALLDQHLVAGIGNMWLAEALWHARVSPWLRLGEVTDPELQAALVWAQAAMRAAVAGKRGSRAVYRRTGRPCPRCGERVRSRGLGDANRIAYWCLGCQRAGDAPPLP